MTKNDFESLGMTYNDLKLLNTPYNYLKNDIMDKKVKRGPTDRPTDRPTDGPTKWGVESRSTRLKKGSRKSLERSGMPSLHSYWRGSANCFPDERRR